MTILSVKSGTGGSLRIELADGSFFSFKPCYFPPVFIDESLYTPGVADGCEINADEEEAFRFASACLRAEKHALQLIARAEQTVFGISRKLEKRGHKAACVRAAVGQLSDLGLLDDRRFAGLWLESRLCRQVSTPRRLFAGLYSRGVDRNDAETALRDILDSETEQRLLERYVQKQRRKINAASDEDPAARRSLKYLLKGEGFSHSAIQIFFESEE